MASYALIRPEDGNAARQASDWADRLSLLFVANGHSNLNDLDASSPANALNIRKALGGLRTSLICYFGHGDEQSWLTAGASTVQAPDFMAAKGKAIASIACKTGCNLGPDAVTAGVECWLGFTIQVAVIQPHKGLDPIGDAIVEGLALLGASGTIENARAKISSGLEGVMHAYDTGKYGSHPAHFLGYFAAMAMRDHVVVHGNAQVSPL